MTDCILGEKWKRGPFSNNIQIMQRPVRAKTPEDNAAAQLRVARKRLLKFQADNAELELTQERGSLIPVELHDHLFAEIRETVRWRLMQVPKIAHRLENQSRAVIKDRAAI